MTEKNLAGAKKKSSNKYNIKEQQKRSSPLEQEIQELLFLL